MKRKFFKKCLKFFVFLTRSPNNSWRISCHLISWFQIYFLDMRRDVQDIFRQTPHEKQCMMFSATLSKEIRPVCKKFMQDVIIACRWDKSLRHSRTLKKSDPHGKHHPTFVIGQVNYLNSSSCLPLIFWLGPIRTNWPLEKSTSSPYRNFGMSCSPRFSARSIIRWYDRQRHP